ncbi:hypothetical protein [Rhodopseudomonas palustris]|uniref:hypothetical protein n=1 Tax=Rhodopseudomonas palustris TaxID=1076 RepID=UPI0012376879|nr:hypothetical protein [Rhodopseudomonas palustris]QLH72211.1 hypothetical protein HZF03_16020 [Rhodopseudomonas palustris]
MIVEFNALSDEFRKRERLRYPPTTVNLIASNIKLALKTKAMGTGLIIEHLALSMLRNFVEIVEVWSANVRARATARINGNANAAADTV